jgi:thiamine-monophosphate kinase
VGEDTLGTVGEDGLIASVLVRYGPSPALVRVGPGDDAAVLDLAGPVVVSTDTLVETHDFRRDWSSGFDVGVKTAAQNLADVAAMGARPVALLVSLAAPADLPARFARDLADGLADECARAGASVVGGDVSAASEVVVTGTALGVLDGGRPAVLRSGARPGDVVALAGVTGPSAAGLALLLAGRGPDDGDAAAVAVRAHLAPRPPYEAGPAAAAAGATALIDTSDGLLRDAGRLAAASGAVLDLDPAALAPGADLVAVAALLGAADPAARALEWALAGGEDHALLACFPAGTALPAGFRAVGAVRAGDPGVLVGGRPWTGPTGWHHFT